MVPMLLLFHVSQCYLPGLELLCDILISCQWLTELSLMNSVKSNRIHPQACFPPPPPPWKCQPASMPSEHKSIQTYPTVIFFFFLMFQPEVMIQRTKSVCSTPSICCARLHPDRRLLPCLSFCILGASSDPVWDEWIYSHRFTFP